MEAGLTLGAAKRTLAATQVEFLGHVMSAEGLKPNPRLLQCIRGIKRPENATEVRSFLHLVGYYRRFIKNFSTIASPLNALLEKGKDIEWTPACEGAFVELRNKLLEEPIPTLVYPSESTRMRQT